MSRLIAFDVDERRAAAQPGAAFGALADGLAAELEPLIERGAPMPAGKAKLTKIGGRCPVHGVYLEFDPWQPHSHRCALCDIRYEAPEHDDWWAMGAHLYTAERAVHAATLFLLRGDPRHATLATDILLALAERYGNWPNSDNVLGPSRPFFSTYLESIWLLNLCHAVDLMEEADAPGFSRVARTVRQKLIVPSAELIAGFPEGMSNRQVWNEVAVLSALTLLDDEVALMRRLDHEDGLFGLLERGLLADGSWYEGENYHLFAHRGLWYGVQLLGAMAESGDDRFVLPEEFEQRYLNGFVTPFLGMLPDDTLPSRNDSQYRISLHQWRIAEHLELGYAHRSAGGVARDDGRSHTHVDDTRVAALLTRIYAGDRARALVHDATARARSTADAERNTPASRVSRADLSWRALLVAEVSEPPMPAWEPGSVFLPAQGLTVIRRERARVYAALEGGTTGGGHGHPHQLALTLQSGADRWLEDPGTGSYVDRTLHWYRSTFAHAAPLFDGASQKPVAATTLAFEDRGGAGWISKRVAEIAPGVSATRTVIVCDGYLVDVLEWEAARLTRVTLPLCGSAGDAALGATAWESTAVRGAGGLEDGFDFVARAERRRLAPNELVALSTAPASVDARDAHARARLWYATSDANATLGRGEVPGAPGSGATMRHWLDASGERGRVVGVWSWPQEHGEPLVASVTLDAFGEAIAVVTTRDGTTASHARVPHGWHIDLAAGGARSSLDLENLPPQAADAAAGGDGVAENAVGSADIDHELDEFDEEGVDAPLAADFDVPWVEDDAALGMPGDYMEDALQLPVGLANYLQTELSWKDAGEPSAMVQLARTATHFIVDVSTETGPVVSQIADDTGAFRNSLDNENPDVNADGLQWYIGVPDAGRWSDGALVAAAPWPESSDDEPVEPRSHALVPDGTAKPVIRWLPTTDGWAMRLLWELEALPMDADGCIAFDLLVNERTADRQRRRGQLVLSGGGGFAYVRGDRHDPGHALVIAIG